MPSECVSAAQVFGGVEPHIVRQKSGNFLPAFGCKKMGVKGAKNPLN
jgi:hypothetical protein